MNNLQHKQELQRREVQLRALISENERTIAKLDTEQLAIKILLNSLYGALG